MFDCRSIPIRGKTFFSESWTPKIIYGKIIEALKNVDKSELVLRKDGKIKIIGITNDGMKIVLILILLVVKFYLDIPYT